MHTDANLIAGAHCCIRGHTCSTIVVTTSQILGTVVTSTTFSAKSLYCFDRQAVQSRLQRDVCTELFIAKQEQWFSWQTTRSRHPWKLACKLNSFLPIV